MRLRLRAPGSSAMSSARGARAPRLGSRDDLFDGLGGFRGEGLDARLGQVGGGDLEAVEEEAGAAWIELVGGDAAKDVDDGELEADAVVAVRELEVEGGLATAARARVWGGFAGGVVVEAEIFAAEGG